MGLIDVHATTWGYDDKDDISKSVDNSVEKVNQQMGEKLVNGGISDNSEAGVRNALDKQIELNDNQRRQMAENIGREYAFKRNGKNMSYEEFQKYLSESFQNCIPAPNAQQIIKMATIDGVRKGLSPEISNNALIKISDKTKTSAVTIPTVLLGYIQREVGGLDLKITQNDLVTGFLYWYFGKPDDIIFASKETASKVLAVSEALSRNASSSKLSELNYNMTEAALDKIDDMNNKLDSIRKLMAGLTNDSIDHKTELKKISIAVLYNILSYSGMTPPILSGQGASDIDLLAQGQIWDILSALDNAYEYFENTRGREIYKAKYRQKVNRFAYSPERTVEFNSNNNDNNMTGEANNSVVQNNRPELSGDIDPDDYDPYGVWDDPYDEILSDETSKSRVISLEDFIKQKGIPAVNDDDDDD